MNKQQILSVMEADVRKSLRAFNAAAADVVNSSYIIVAGKISRLLQSIASSRPLYEYMAERTSGYNFVEEFRTRQFSDEHGRPYIDVPQEADELLRFAFCLLFAIDTGKLNLENLLHTFYTDSDANAEFNRFCTEIVAPFVASLNAAFGVTVPPESTPAPAPDLRRERSEEGVTAADVFSAATFAPPEEQDALPETDGVIEALAKVTDDIAERVQNSEVLPDEEREELLLVCEAFATALSVREIKPLRIMFIALKNTLRGCSDFAYFEEQYNDLVYVMDGLQG